MNYKPPDLNERLLARIPNWLWPSIDCAFLQDGYAHYYSASGQKLCVADYRTNMGYEANECDPICPECLHLFQMGRMGIEDS